VIPARLLLPALRWAADSGFAHLERDAKRALDLGVGGFIIFGGPASVVRHLTDDLTSYAGRPLVFAADLERGAGQQFSGLTEIPPPAALGSLGDRDAVRHAGYVTATDARSVGINLVLAPVADLDLEPANPIVQSRAFAADPDRVADSVAAWVGGCQEGGCWASVKHFPGHGRTTVDSHAVLPVVDASAEVLERTDLAPFRAAVEGGVATVMTAHVQYPALDPAHAATYSSAILEYLRGTIGFDGAVLTDALIMAGAKQAGGAGDGAVAAIAAGIDLLLYPEAVEEIVAALEHALREGIVPEERFASALRRYQRLLDDLPGAVSVVEDANSWSETIADSLLKDGLVRGSDSRVSELNGCLVIDDDIGGPFPLGPTDLIPRSFAGATGAADAGRLVLLFAEPRGWKERVGLSDDSLLILHEALSRAGLVVVFGHPRIADEVPGDAPLLLAWHRQPLMQQAVVRWLGARGR
jgi:beta-glucosidase-like glycosyl hydrolase